MGVIRKKTATRGGEGGVKYVCDVCSADITSTVCQYFYPHCDFAKEWETSCRSAYDVMSATTTISAYNASQMGARLTTTTQPRIHSMSLNRTHFRSTIKTGEQTRS